jgi:hypothetical protein
MLKVAGRNNPPAAVSTRRFWAEEKPPTLETIAFAACGLAAISRGNIAKPQAAKRDDLQQWGFSLSPKQKHIWALPFGGIE